MSVKIVTKFQKVGVVIEKFFKVVVRHESLQKTYSKNASGCQDQSKSMY